MNTVSYYGTNIIEGQNKEFVTMWTYGYQGISNTTVNVQRYLESDFLKAQVWANKIDSVIDLIIIDTNTNETRTVSVYSTLLVEVNRKVTFLENRKEGIAYVVYEYDREGIPHEISVEFIEEETNALKLKPEE